MEIVKVKASEIVDTVKPVVSEMYRSVRGSLPVAVQSLLDRLTEWLTATRAGRTTLGLVAFLFARPIIDKAWRIIRGYPSGTIGVIPVLSNFLQLSKARSDFYYTQKEKYGNLSMHWIGATSVSVYINDFETANRIYNDIGQTHRFQYRTPEEQEKLELKMRAIQGISSFVYIDDQPHTDRRKLMAASLLRIVDSNYLDQTVERWMNAKLFPILDKSDVWLNQRSDIGDATFNTILRISFGFDLEPTVEEWRDFIEGIVGKFHGLGGLLASRSLPSPLVVPVAKALTGNQYHKYHVRCQEIIQSWLKIFEQSPTFTDELIELYAGTMIKEAKDPHKNVVNMEKAAADINNIFEAATHTTTSNTEGCLYNCAKYPDCQDKLYNSLCDLFVDEIRDGNVHSKIGLAKLQKCAYLRAFIYESMRLSNAPPCSMPRYIRQEFKVDGYTIPKGAFILLNSSGISRDKELWGDDALEFNPDRWLIPVKKKKDDDSSDATAIQYQFNQKLTKRIMLFGMGRRDCPGKSVGIKQIMLALTHLVLRYQFETPTGNPNQVPFIEWVESNKTEAPLLLKVIKRPEK